MSLLLFDLLAIIELGRDSTPVILVISEILTDLSLAEGAQICHHRLSYRVQVCKRVQQAARSGGMHGEI